MALRVPQAARLIQTRLASHIRPHARNLSYLEGGWHNSSDAGERDSHPWARRSAHDFRISIGEGGAGYGDWGGGDSMAVGFSGEREARLDYSKTQRFGEDDENIGQQLAKVEQERVSSKAYVRSQMQFLMVLSSTQSTAYDGGEGGGGGEMGVQGESRATPHSLSPSIRPPTHSHTHRTHATSITTRELSISGASPLRRGVGGGGGGGRDATSKSLAFQAISMLKSETSLSALSSGGVYV